MAPPLHTALLHIATRRYKHALSCSSAQEYSIHLKYEAASFEMAELVNQTKVKTEVCRPTNTVVVTGFGPFKKHNINASWEAVKLLPGSGLEKELGIHLVVDEVPVSYESVGTTVPQMWDRYKPLLVIHVGVSELAKKVTLEQVAKKDGYKKVDVDGCTPLFNECCVGSSPLICSALDITELNNNINSTSTSIQTQLSDDAGRYLCEYIYYTSLSIDSSRALFVHVPPLGKPYSAEELCEGLADIVRCLVKQLQNKVLES